MKIENLRIVVDEREKKSGIPDLLKAVGVNLEIRTLPVGDYIVAPETIVERKSVHDLISSVFDGRLFDQCSRLKEHFANPVILLEGNIDEIEDIVENPFVFYGALASVAIDFKIPVIPTPNATHTAKLLISLASRKEITKGPFLKKIKKSDNLQRQQLAVLCSLPGIGEKLATRMLQKFGSPARTINASLAELSKVEGVGEAKARKIKQMLEHTSNLKKEFNQSKLEL